jgi:TPP-dependent 2-oxoacid decarboxylase
MKQTIGDLLPRRLNEAGVGWSYPRGTPSDVHLEFIQLEDWGQQRRMGGRNPINASWAGDCCARPIGWAVMVVRTLSAANGIGGAYANPIFGIGISGGQYGNC